jgi:hypothetical protein
MAYIGPLPAETFTSFATQEFSTSATTSYTLDHPVTNENELALFINNVRQQPGSGKAYTASGTALTLSAATASTDTMYAVFLGRALQTVNPADASVGTSQLAATSVTAAKLNNDIISGTTALAEAPADTDEFLVSDAGTLKRIDYSYIKGGGAYEHIKTTTVSSAVTSVQFIHGSSGVTLDSSFGKYVLSFKNLITGTADQRIKFRITTDGSSFEDTGYYMAGYRGYSQGSSGQGSDVVYGTSPELMNGNTKQAISTGTHSGIITIDSPQTGKDPLFMVDACMNDGSYAIRQMTVITYNTNTTFTGVEIIPASGTLTGGEYTLLGMKNS